MESSSNKFVALIAILALPFAADAFLLSWAPSNQFFDFSPKNDGYVELRNISKMIEDSQESTVTVFVASQRNEVPKGPGGRLIRKYCKLVPRRRR
jgi:hypothetical protein